MRHTAYLIVICDPVTNALLSATIWSSPEWEQSRCIKARTFVAYQMGGTSYQDAQDRLVEAIKEPRCRYHYLYNILERR